MTLHEFKCWLEGISENISDSPSPNQWKLILNKLKGIETETIFVPRIVYVPMQPSLTPNWQVTCKSFVGVNTSGRNCS